VIVRSAALCAALSTAIGCASTQSVYVRQSAAPGELVWRYDDRLQVTRNGQVVAEADRWDGLAAAVACVPRARNQANAATSRHRTGTALLWTGVLSMFAGVGVFAEEIARTDGNPPAAVVLGSLVALLAGTIVAPTGGYLRATATVRGIDAVNLYNDSIVAGAACTR
jgi:hypothetical protein